MDEHKLTLSNNATSKYKGCIVVGYTLLQDVDLNIIVKAFMNLFTVLYLIPPLIAISYLILFVFVDAYLKLHYLLRIQILFFLFC